MKETAQIAENARKQAELARQREAALWKTEFHQKVLNENMRKGLDTGRTSINLKYAAKELAQIDRELNKLK